MKDCSEMKVYKSLQLYCQKQPQGVSASDLALSMNLSRNVISHYLNRLMEKDLAVKTGSKPVLWRPLDQENSNPDTEGQPENPTPKAPDSFQNLIGWNGSMSKIIDECKAAVGYPPYGLPILITGQTGVGKSHLARRIYDYAVDSGIVSSKTPFVTFNCADYANNPQLLSAALFGYKKGTFTGAVADHEGLLKKANNGFLFLDEVHRLSYENQEKLFIVMDQGWYRSLGEDSAVNNVRIRFIFATTEDVNAVLLETFRRRITVKLNLIPYTQRPLSERIALITLFYSQEAKAIRRQISVTPEVINILCHADIEGNLGMLQNIVKLSCANSLSSQGGSALLTVDIKNLNSDWIDYKYIVQNQFSRPLVLRDGFTPASLPIDSVGDLDDFFTEVSRAKSKNDLYMLDLKYKKLMETTRYRSGVSPLFIQATEALYRRALFRYGIALNGEEIEWAAQWDCLRRESIEKRYDCQGFRRFVERHRPRSLYIVNRMTNDALSFYGFDSADDGILFVLIFFLISPKVEEDLPLHGLIIAHGDSTATSIANVANSLCGTFIFEAFNMPVSTSIKDIIDKVSEYIRNIDTRQGLIILVDMGSLGQMYSSIKNNVRGDLLIVNNVTTSIAVDIGLKIKQRVKFREIAEYSIAGYRSESQYYEGVACGENIIISCISGIGIANKIKAILDDYIDHDRLEVVTMDYRSLKQALNSKDHRDFIRTKLIITTTDIAVEQEINILNLSEIWQLDGENLLYNNLKDYMNSNRFDALKDELIRFFSYEGMSGKLLFLNPQIIIEEVAVIIEKYEQHYHLRLESFKRFNLYLHIAVMIERLMVGPHDKKESAMEDSAEIREFVETTREIFADIVEKYNLSLDLYEVLLLHELIYS